MNDNDPYQPHAHEPNPQPPSTNADFELVTPDGRTYAIPLEMLTTFPHVRVTDCLIVSTGHGTTGPFTFSGVRLLDLIQSFVPENWTQAEVISGDGFGNRVYKNELLNPEPARPFILATRIDGQPMKRDQGLVRLIVPDETDDALRQVKWVARINVRH